MSKEMSIKKATLINAVSKYTNVLTNLLFTAILARLLSPKDYGVVAVITVFTNFFVILTDMGLGTGIIQNKTLTKREVSHIFSLSVYIGLVLALLFGIVGYPISLFYKEAAYTHIASMLSVSLFFYSLDVVPNALLMKNQEFIKVAIRNITVPILTNIIAIILALLGMRYYALVLQSVSSAIIIFSWNYFSVRKEYNLKFRFKLDLSGFDKIKSYSGYQFSFSLVNYFSRNFDNLVISRFLGEASLGFYDKAYKLMVYPLSMLTNIITPSLQPILSRYQDDKEYIYSQYIKIIQILSLCGIFIVPLCFISSREIILIMFGSKWEAAIPCFKYLSLSVWCQLLTSSTGGIFQSLNNTKAMFKSAVINTLITVTVIIIGISTGKIAMVALGVSCAYLVNYFITFKILMVEAFNKKMRDINKIVAQDFIYMIVVTIIMNIIFEYLVTSSVFLSLIIKGITLLLIYIVYLVISHKMGLFLSILRR